MSFTESTRRSALPACPRKSHISILKSIFFHSNKKAVMISHHCFQPGDPREIRTPDTLIRSQVLYPAELLGQMSTWLYYHRKCIKARDKGELLFIPYLILPDYLFYPAVHYKAPLLFFRFSVFWIHLPYTYENQRRARQSAQYDDSQSINKAGPWQCTYKHSHTSQKSRNKVD